MFSRVFLGMHAINQVLFGFMLGMYSLIPYYLFLERRLLFIIRTAIDSQDKKPIIFIWLSLILICFGVEVLATFIPIYDNGSYISVIQAIPKCE
jgi:ABC-type multidrug transport system permease subunit